MILFQEGFRGNYVLIFYKDKKQTFLTTYIDLQDAATKVNLRTRRRHSEIIFK